MGWRWLNSKRIKDFWAFIAEDGYDERPMTNEWPEEIEVLKRAFKDRPEIKDVFFLGCADGCRDLEILKVAKKEKRQLRTVTCIEVTEKFKPLVVRRLEAYKDIFGEFAYVVN